MYKVYKYNSGKLLPQFETKKFDTVQSAIKTIGWFFECKRGARDIQFVICDENEIVNLIKFEDL